MRGRSFFVAGGGLDGSGGLTAVKNGKIYSKGMNAARQSYEHFSSVGSANVKTEVK